MKRVRIVAASLLIPLAGCLADAPSAPAVHVTPSGYMAPEHERVQAGITPWLNLGFTWTDDPDALPRCPRRWYETGDINCTIAITAAPADGPGGARADLHGRSFTIDPGVRGWDLWLLSAHEIGHILLDANHHEGVGLMNGAITASSLTDDDRAFACQEIAICL